MNRVYRVRDVIVGVVFSGLVGAGLSVLVLLLLPLVVSSGASTVRYAFSVIVLEWFASCIALMTFWFTNWSDEKPFFSVRYARYWK